MPCTWCTVVLPLSSVGTALESLRCAPPSPCGQWPRRGYACHSVCLLGGFPSKFYVYEIKARHNVGSAQRCATRNGHLTLTCMGDEAGSGTTLFNGQYSGPLTALQG